MSSLDSLIAQAGEAPLAMGLNYELPPTNTAVVSRRQHVRAYPTSASSLSVAGTRTARIRLGGDDFLDTSSVRLMYTIKNLEDKALKPAGGPWTCWAQVFLRSQGVEMDNQPNYGRFHQQFYFDHLSMAEQYGEAGLCGVHGSWGQIDTIQPQMGFVKANGSYTVMHKLGLSAFESGKLWPLRYAPLELECTLADKESWLAVNSTASATWEIQNIQLLYDTMLLDESVISSFYSALLANRTLSVPFMTAYSTTYPIPDGSTSISVSSVRAFTRLSHIYVTFRKAGAKNASFICPRLQPADSNVPQPTLVDTAGPTARLSIGGSNWPDSQPNSSIVEQFYQFQKALAPRIPNIDREVFQTSAYCLAWNLQRTPGDPTTSISTRSGDLVRIDIQGMEAGVASEMHVTMFAFSVCAIRESGVSILN